VIAISTFGFVIEFLCLSSFELHHFFRCESPVYCRLDPGIVHPTTGVSVFSMSKEPPRSFQLGDGRVDVVHLECDRRSIT